MRFMTDRCAGRRLAEWLRTNGHDVLEAQSLGSDPGDRALLEYAAAERRIFITVDKDYGELIFVHRAAHHGLIRLPDVEMSLRIALVERLITEYRQELEAGAIMTIQGERIRTSYSPNSPLRRNGDH